MERRQRQSTPDLPGPPAGPDLAHVPDLWSTHEEPLFDLPEVPAMTWFKVDDRLAFHPKVLDAGNAAMGLWLRAGAWASSQLTDGYVPASLLTSLGGRQQHADALVKAGLWTQDGDGWRFHDWHVYQPTAHDVKLGREAESQGGRRGNHIRWHRRKNVVDPTCEFCKDEQSAEDST